MLEKRQEDFLCMLFLPKYFEGLLPTSDPGSNAKEVCWRGERVLSETVENDFGHSGVQKKTRFFVFYFIGLCIGN